MEEVGSMRPKYWGLRTGYLITFAALIGLEVMAWFTCRLWFWLLLAPCVLAFGYTLYKLILLSRNLRKLVRSAEDRLKLGGKDTVFRLTIPALVVTQDKEIVCVNRAFETATGLEGLFGSRLNKITPESLEGIQTHPGRTIQIQSHYFKAYAIPSSEEKERLWVLLFVEITNLQKTYEKYQKTKPVVMNIMLDSYEEVIKNIPESEKTRVLSEINRDLEDYIARDSGFLRKLERDRYLAVVENDRFQQMVEDKFSILDTVRNMSSWERVPITLSIGIGCMSDSISQNEKDASTSLEMALGRGGDQVAIKTANGYDFFGGVSKGVEKRTKVKSRILANAMSELVEASDNVLVMGHSYADLDAIGAAVGMARACACMGKDVRIVVNRQKCLATQLIDHLAQNGEDGFFATEEEVLPAIRRDTLLFIVDTHSANFVESRKVYEACKRVVVIDHHRKVVDYIENTLISYHEPYASSASEMVTELVQYFPGCKLTTCDAEALMSGIMLDTKNFIMKTGVRTFEAAAYLRRMGADTVVVKKLFAGSMETYQRRSSLVTAAEIYRRCAIAVTEIPMEDIRVVAPQAADELLGINNVDASFVLYREGEVVHVSARSMGGMNVQLIMEKLGGGGHLSMAGAQVKAKDCSKVKKQLLEAIDEYYDTM